MTLPLDVAPTPAVASPAAGAATRLEFVVYGRPAPQGSKRAMPIYRGSAAKGTREFTGRAAVIESSAGALTSWREAVRYEAARAHGGRPPLDCPLRLTATFSMPPLASKPRRGDHHWAGGELYPTSRPDLSHLVRAIEDALVDAGAIKDDARFVEHVIRQRYAGRPGALAAPGARIAISPIEET